MPRTRRSISPQFKAQTVLDLLTGVSNQAEICRQHQLSPALVARWKAILAPPSARQHNWHEGSNFPREMQVLGS
jgi:hypothetical protein